MYFYSDTISYNTQSMLFKVKNDAADELVTVSTPAAVILVYLSSLKLSYHLRVVSLNILTRNLHKYVSKIRLWQTFSEKLSYSPVFSSANSNPCICVTS